MVQASNTTRPTGRSVTKSASKGREVGLSDPIDRGYICQKICDCSERTEIVNKLGHPLKQRCVTARIQKDEE